MKAGTERIFDGQIYRLVREDKHIRRDLTETTLAVWSSACATCGAEFQIRTPASAMKFAPNRRCEKHHRPGSKVKQMQRAEA